MTTSALVFMTVSVGFVVILTFWCFKRVLQAPKPPSEQVKDFHSA